MKFEFIARIITVSDSNDNVNLWVQGIGFNDEAC